MFGGTAQLRVQAGVSEGDGTPRHGVVQEEHETEVDVVDDGVEEDAAAAGEVGLHEGGGGVGFHGLEAEGEGAA